MVTDNWLFTTDDLFIIDDWNPGIVIVKLSEKGLGYIFKFKSLSVRNGTETAKFFCTFERVELWDTAFDKMQPAGLTASTR